MKKRAFELFIFVVLAVLPVSLIAYAFWHEIELETSALRAEKMQALEISTERFAVPDVMTRIPSEALWELFSAAVNQKDPKETFFREIRNIKNRFPGVFEFALFSPDGKLVPEISDLEEYHSELNSFGSDYLALRAMNSAPLKANLEKYRPFLGPVFLYFGKTKMSFTLLQGSFTPRRSYLFLTPFRPGLYWFLAWVSFPKDGKELAFRLKPPDLGSFSREAMHDIIDINEPEANREKRFGKASEHLPGVFALLGETDGEIVANSGYLWTQVRITPTKRLIISLPDTCSEAFITAKGFLFGGLIIILFLGFLIFGLLPVIKEGSFSLRTKLISLFVYTTGVPLLLLFISAQGLFHERRQTMEKKIYNRHEDIVNEFNRNFLDYEGFLEEASQKLKGPPLPVGASDLDALAVARKIEKGVKPELFILFNERGKTIYNTGRAFKALLQHLSTILGIQFGKRISEFNGTDLPPADSAKEQTIMASVESFGIDVDEIRSIFESSPNSFVTAMIGKEKLNSLEVSFYDRMKKLRYLGFLGWGDGIYDRYNQSRLSAFQKNLKETSMVGGTLDDVRVSSAFPVRESIIGMEIQLNQQALPIHKRVVQDGKIYLVTGMKGIQPGRYFFAASSDKPIGEEIEKTTDRLKLIGSLILALGVGAGFLISRSFLKPVGLLERGIESMRCRDFSARIEVVSNDELGLLSETFNNVMDNMADLEVARIVQDTFFPMETLSGSGWEIFGSSVSASRVGGDYFDYFRLKDGRWLVLIGDVSGHGVPAALVVAMAKALVKHPGNPDRPSQILEIINQGLVGTLHGRRLMSCFLSIFDPLSGNLVASNAGHNYPILVKSDSTSELAINVCLLGVKKKKPFPDHSFSLADSPFLCFYTDGIIEALDENGVMIGYERFKKALPGLLRSSARETEAAIRRWFHTVAAPGPLADDITLVVLQKTEFQMNQRY